MQSAKDTENPALSFEKKALELFRYQSENNPVYKEFIRHMEVNVADVQRITQIPFLPVSFFKTHRVADETQTYSRVFKSSSTSGTERSRHHIADENLYRKSILRSFSSFYQTPEKYHFLALLPSYMEQGDSSLIYMVQYLMERSGSPYSDFYLDDFRALKDRLTMLEKDKSRRPFLIGVSYALLDFAAYCGELPLKRTIIMETGGMKGRRKEMIKEELHLHLRKAFHVPEIHSEYGMTELLSQAYSTGKGIFRTPPQMRVFIREAEDPLAYCPYGKSGGINIIDLSNVHSCAFIATDDMGKKYQNGSFEVLGRFDTSDIRGCNLMVE